MSRAQKIRRRGERPGTSAQRQPTKVQLPAGVAKRDGRERPDPFSRSPVVPTDPQARIIKTRS